MKCECVTTGSGIWDYHYDRSKCSIHRDLFPDCRCKVCGNCKHDHGGFYHEWVSKEEN